VPERMDWSQASLDIEHDHAQWSQWGVTLPNGKPLPADAPKASLLLPMGRLGPAFLVYPNFRIFTEWNHSLIYSTTASYLATRIAGAPVFRKGNGTPDNFSMEQVRELQMLLEKAGYDVGGVMTSAVSMAVSARFRARPCSRRRSSSSCRRTVIRPRNW